MNSQQKAVIVRYLNGSYSADDLREVERMLSRGIDKRQWKKLLDKQEWPDIVPAEERMQEAIFERIQNEVSRSKEKRKGLVTKRLVAAVAASLVLVAGIFGYQHFGFPPSLITPPLTNASADTTPSFLVMDDQSEIWINSGSTIHYPARFSFGKREVVLKGQAFFNVAKEKKRKFVVHVGEIDIKVLGTSFDVKSYPKENETVITLLTGKLDVELPDDNRHTLLPNQQLIFDKTTKMVTLRNVNVEHYDNWREGEIIFTNLPLVQIAKGLERKFNKTFVIAEELKERLITLKLKGGGLREALEIVSHSANVSYSIEGEKVIINQEEVNKK